MYVLFSVTQNQGKVTKKCFQYPSFSICEENQYLQKSNQVLISLLNNLGVESFEWTLIADGTR